MFFDLSRINNSSFCFSSAVVCADKMQAYTALGERLQVRGYIPLSPPVGYEPYE